MESKEYHLWMDKSLPSYTLIIIIIIEVKEDKEGTSMCLNARVQNIPVSAYALSYTFTKCAHKTLETARIMEDILPFGITNWKVKCCLSQITKEFEKEDKICKVSSQTL